MTENINKIIRLETLINLQTNSLREISDYIIPQIQIVQ
jgi:hypothetical protein